MSETDTDRMEGWKQQGVTTVRRITIRRQNSEISTKHIILAFNRSTVQLFNSCTVYQCRLYLLPCQGLHAKSARLSFNLRRFGNANNSCRGRLTREKCSVHGQHNRNLPNCTIHLQQLPSILSDKAYSWTCDKL